MGDAFYLIGVILVIFIVGTLIGLGIKRALESTKAFDTHLEDLEDKDDDAFSYKDVEMPVASINIIKPEVKVTPRKREAAAKEAKPRKPRESRKKDIEK